MLRTDSNVSATEKGAGARSTNRLPPRASSSTSLAVAHRQSAAL